MFACSLHAAAFQQFHDAGWCGRQETRLTKLHQTDIKRCESVDVLLRVDRVDDLCLVDVFWQRQLDDVAVDFLVVVKEVDEFQHFFLCGVGWQAIHRARHTHRVAGFLLRCHVSLACAVLAHYHCCEMWGVHASVQHTGHFSRYLFFHCVGNGFAVDNFIFYIHF